VVDLWAEGVVVHKDNGGFTDRLPVLFCQEVPLPRNTSFDKQIQTEQ
jgi:hypothetical protein